MDVGPTTGDSSGPATRTTPAGSWAAGPDCLELVRLAQASEAGAPAAGASAAGASVASGAAASPVT